MNQPQPCSERLLQEKEEIVTAWKQVVAEIEPLEKRLHSLQVKEKTLRSLSSKVTDAILYAREYEGIISEELGEVSLQSETCSPSPLDEEELPF